MIAKSSFSLMIEVFFTLPDSWKVSFTWKRYTNWCSYCTRRGRLLYISLVESA